MKIKLLITLFLIITTRVSGQVIDRISFNYGITSSDLEWKYEQDHTFPIYNDWGNQKIIGFYSGLDFEYLIVNILHYQQGWVFIKRVLWMIGHQEHLNGI